VGGGALEGAASEVAGKNINEVGNYLTGSNAQGILPPNVALGN
jgi:hypothetical protein